MISYHVGFQHHWENETEVKKTLTFMLGNLLIHFPMIHTEHYFELFKCVFLPHLPHTRWRKRWQSVYKRSGVWTMTVTMKSESYTTQWAKKLTISDIWAVTVYQDVQKSHRWWRLISLLSTDQNTSPFERYWHRLTCTGDPSSFIFHGDPISSIFQGDLNSLIFQGDPSSLIFKGHPKSLIFKGDPNSWIFKGDPSNLVF